MKWSCFRPQLVKYDTNSLLYTRENLYDTNALLYTRENLCDTNALLYTRENLCDTNALLYTRENLCDTNSRAAYPSVFGGRNTILGSIWAILPIIRFHPQIFRFFLAPFKIFCLIQFLPFGSNLIKSLAEFCWNWPET